MTSLKHTNDVSDQGIAVPGGVRRWRAFSLLTVTFFMTIMDLSELKLQSLDRVPGEEPLAVRLKIYSERSWASAPSVPTMSSRGIQLKDKVAVG